MRSYIFISIAQITFKHGSLILISRHSFQWCWWIFPNLLMTKVEKKNIEGYNERRSTSNTWEMFGEGRGEGGNAYKALLFLPFHSSLNPQILVVHKTSNVSHNVQSKHSVPSQENHTYYPMYHISCPSWLNKKLQCCQ